MKILTTPKNRFEHLPNYNFSENYIEIEFPDLKIEMHYLDEGDQGADHIFLCLHGEPTWSYLYRKMIPIFAQEGRVIAPDLIGFGKSQKPGSIPDTSFTLYTGDIVYTFK